MSLNYPVTHILDIFDLVSLTTSYAGNTRTMQVDGMTQMMLFLTYTPGAGGGGNSIEIRLESGPSAGEVHQHTSVETVTGVSTLYQQEYTFTGAVAGTDYTLRIPIPMADPYLTVSIKETVLAGAAGIASLKIGINGK